MLRLIITLACFGIAAYFVWDFVRGFRKAEGGTWERIFAAGRDSATILWSRAVAFGSAVVGFAAGAAEYLNAPGVADAIRSMIQPEFVPAFVLGVALITEFARRRTL